MKTRYFYHEDQPEKFYPFFVTILVDENDIVKKFCLNETNINDEIKEHDWHSVDLIDNELISFFGLFFEKIKIGQSLSDKITNIPLCEVCFQ